MDSLRSKLKRRREDCSGIRRDNKDNQAQLDRVDRFVFLILQIFNNF